MAKLKSVFFDTSVLIGGLIEIEGSNAPAQQLLQAVAENKIRQPCTAWHCCLEFYSVTTRLPEEYRLSPEIALLLIEQEITERFLVTQLSPSRNRAMLRAAARDKVIGGRIYDAHIAEIARHSSCEILVTENKRHFATLLRQEVNVMTSAEALSSLSLI